MTRVLAAFRPLMPALLVLSTIATPALADPPIVLVDPPHQTDTRGPGPWRPFDPDAITPAPTRRLPSCAKANTCDAVSDLWFETRAGFVNRFAMTDIRDAATKKERDPARLVAGLLERGQMKLASFEAPFINLAAEGKLERREPTPIFALAARVHSTARDALLRISVNGRVTVALNGKTIFDESGDQFMLVDHRTVPIHLRAGWNELAIRLEKVSPYALSLSLRLRGTDHMPLSDLVWSTPLSGAATTSRSDLCAAFASAIERTITVDGWTLTGVATAQGLLPWPAPKQVTLTRNGTTLADMAFDPDAAESALSMALPADADGKVALLIDGQACATLDHDPQPALRRRYLEAVYQIDGLADRTLGPGGRDSLRYQADDVRDLLSGPRARRQTFPRPAVAFQQRRLEPALTHLERLITNARKDVPPFQKPGMHIRAYRSDFDGTLQRYVVHVPASYRSTPKSANDLGAPLIILSHGLHYSPEDMMRIAFAKPTGPNEAFRAGHIYTWNPPDAPNGAIVVAHDGYRNGGQRPPGEADVLRVIAEMQSAYRINPRKISISGFSLGGSTAFWVPFHSPSVFSASAPLCGYPNIHEYRSVKAAAKRPWEQRLLDEEGVVAYAESGRYLPLWMIHGSMDNPARSELIHNRYKTLRYASQLDIPALGHNVWDKAFEDDKLLRWLSARSRPEVAPQPVLRTARHRFNAAHWLRLDRFDRGPRGDNDAHFAQLEGQLKGERLQVSTRGVAALTLLGEFLGPRAERPQTLVVDGRNLGEHVVGRELHLSKSDTWQVVPEVDRPTDAKRPGLEGPIGDVWFGPALVVYGTQIISEIEANRLAAERHRMHSPWIALALPVKADVDVTAEDLTKTSIILIGRPASNSITARAAESLAAAGIRFEPTAIALGDRRFEGQDLAISVIRPSPFNPDRYLVLHAGLSAEGTSSSRYLPEFIPDFLVYGSGMRHIFGDRILGPREVIAGGFFDSNWRLTSPVTPPAAPNLGKKSQKL